MVTVLLPVVCSFLMVVRWQIWEVLRRGLKEYFVSAKFNFVFRCSAWGEKREQNYLSTNRGRGSPLT